MKKIYTYSKLVFAIVAAITLLSSCDEDAALAYDLEGVWQGTITGDYYFDRYGARSNDYDTEIMFQQDSWDRGGTGYEIDRPYGGRGYSKFYFEWTVRNGRIYIDYDDGYSVIIRDFETYMMGGRMRFRGYFDNGITGEQMASFSLIKVVDPNDYYERGYYYSRGIAPSDSTANDSIK